MAAIGTAIFPGAATFPGTGVYPGQGTQPYSWILYTTDDASDTDPLWVDATVKVRSFSTSRGRESELAEVDAGTATLTLDNRTRTFDPVINTGIRPMNRWWIREQFTGETQDIFTGYAESYDQGWDGFDAVATVTCADEFKVLALDALPLMNPPRDTYEDVIMSDNPGSYYRWSDMNLTGTVGPGWVIGPAGGGYGMSNTTPIIGDKVGGAGGAGGSLHQSGTTAVIETEPIAFDPQGSDNMTVEFWYKFSALPGGNVVFFQSAEAVTGALRVFYWELLTTGAVRFNARNSTPTLHQISTAPLVANTWYHVAGVIDGTFIYIYVNGVQAVNAAWTGILLGGGDLNPAAPPTLQGSAGVAHAFDEVAFWPARNVSARLPAHYQAGTQRGFLTQPADERVDAVLDSVASTAARRFGGAANYDVIPTFMHGQSPLEEIRRAVRAETPTGNFFTARDGALVFLATDHRAGSPWATVQATFDDDGTDLPYLSVDLDYSEAFLSNDWNVTRTGGLVQTASDATSIARYFKRSQSISDQPVATDADALDHAQALLAKYKDPMTRITSLVLTTDVPAVSEAVFRLDIGDRIRVFRTPPGGGARIDQTLFVQKINVEGANGTRPWQITLGVSPV